MLRKLCGLILIVVLLAACDPLVEESDSGSSSDGGGVTGDETGVVVDIIDGDTIDVRIGGEVYRVRYISVNTPERDEPCYEDATDANAALVDDQTVTLVRDVSNTDRYGRLLRYVYVGEVFVNAELVREGYAEARSYPPDTTYYDDLEALETAAHQQGLGCHPSGVFR